MPNKPTRERQQRTALDLVLRNKEYELIPVLEKYGGKTLKENDFGTEDMRGAAAASSRDLHLPQDPADPWARYFNSGKGGNRGTRDHTRTFKGNGNWDRRPAGRY